MTKYNRSEIFKRAWAIVREEKVTISVGLKRSWAYVKNPVMTIADKQAVWGNLVNGIAKVELTGTAKQIGWAEKIRMDAIKDIISKGKSMIGKKATDYLMGKYEKATRYLLTKKSDSKFWIDNRDCSSFMTIAFIELQQTWCESKETFEELSKGFYDRKAGYVNANGDCEKLLEMVIVLALKKEYGYSEDKAHYIFTMQRYANRNNAEISVREWSVYGKSRAYFTIDGKDYGYYDNMGGKYVTGKNSVDNL